MTLKLKTIGMGLLSLSLYNAYADSSNFVIKQIRVEGLQRIEVGTVYSYLPVKVGDTLTPSKTDEIIHKLFSTGFFQDVRVEEQGST